MSETKKSAGRARPFDAQFFRTLEDSAQTRDGRATRPSGVRSLGIPGGRTVHDGKDVAPPLVPEKEVSFAEVEGDIQWITLNTPRQFNLGWRQMRSLIAKKWLTHDSSVHSSLYKKFLNRLEMTIEEEMLATGAKKTGVRELRYIAIGMVRGKELFVRVMMLGETFNLPKSFFKECGRALFAL